MPETVTQAELRRRTLDTMEDELRVSDKQAKDFIASLVAVIEGAVGDGDKVSLFGICTLSPGFRLAKPKRKGVDPRTGEERMLDATPNKVTIRSTVAKRIKDALPSPTSAAGSRLKTIAVNRAHAAAKRRAAAEKEAAGAGKAKGKGRK